MQIPFTYVAQGNLVALKQQLITCNINTVDDRGDSFLHIAIKFNQADVFHYLLENYININIANFEGDSPLMLCVYYNRVGFLKQLIKMNPDYTMQNKLGETPFYKACVLGRGPIISILIENKMDTPDCKNYNDENIYFALIRSQNLNLLDFFVAQDVNFIKSTNYFNDTLLHIATKMNSLLMVEYLLNHRAYVNAKNKVKETPIYYASKNGNREIFSLLLQFGALLEMENSYDETVFDVADYLGFKDYIIQKQTSLVYQDYLLYHPLHVAIIKEDIMLVEENLKQRELNKLDKHGYTPLQLAMETKNKVIINMIKKAVKST